MIGQIHSVSTTFYDKITRKSKFKDRPALIIGEADIGDYTILPISTIPDKNKIDPDFDVEIKPSDYPKLHLREVSYVRTHKQTFVNGSCIKQRIIGDMKKDYPTLYQKVMDKLEEFNQQTRRNAL